MLYPNSLRTQCGTEGYVAPEILEHHPRYGTKCDMWSLGVIIYILLGGYRPFRGTGEALMRQIRYGEFEFHDKYWSHVSDSAKELIQSLLTVNPDSRADATQALESAWIQSAEEDLASQSLDSNLQEFKNGFSGRAKLRSIVLGVRLFEGSWRGLFLLFCAHTTHDSFFSSFLLFHKDCCCTKVTKLGREFSLESSTFLLDNLL